MQSRVNTRALTTLDQALRGGPWRESPWDDRSRRFGVAMLEALRDALAGEPVMSAVSAAYATGRSELPLASVVWHETWGRVVLVWAIRETTRAAHATTDGALRAELLRVAAELGAASGQLGAASGQLGAPEGTPTASGSTTPFEQMVDAARDALTNARDALVLETMEGAFLAAYLHQLKHIASLLAVGGHSVDSLVRGAVARTDRVARKEGTAGWMDAGLPTRQAWTQRGLVEAAWALAAQVSHTQDRAEHAREVSLWLARTACALASRVDRVDAWVPLVPDDAVRERSPTPTARPLRLARTADVTETKTMPSPEGAEAVMDNKTNPLLKTLEADAGDAAWRTAGSQFVKLARDPIVALLSRHLAPGDESMRARIAAFLETELGSALLAGMLSAGLAALPLPGNDMPQKLARELRVRSMAGAGDVIADVLMGPLRQVAVLYLQGAGFPGNPLANTSADPAALPEAQDHGRVGTPTVDSAGEVVTPSTRAPAAG